jgi:nickel-dependent lactate racemase
MKTLSIPYGSREITFRIPEHNFSEYLAPNIPTLPESDYSETKQALDNPIGADKIENIVNPSDKVAILCEDITRYAQTSVILSVLVSRLNEAGVPDSNIKIVMALGSHRPMTDEEKIVKVGEELFRRLEVVNSENKNKDKLVDAGLAPGGVRVWLDPTVQAADFKIGVGSIEPHTAAGYTGGGKIIYPGVVGVETVSNFHLISASLGNLTGDPDNQARLTMEAWVDTVGLDYIINAVVTPENDLYKVVAGHYVKAHREGVKFAKKVWGIKSSLRIDIAIVSSFPADLDFWQGGKGIVNCEKAIRDGGMLILVTPCSEGVGPHPEYIDYMGADDPLYLIKTAQQGKVNIEEVLPLAVGAAVARVRQRINIAVISDGLTDAEIKSSGFMPFRSVEEAVEFGLDKYGRDASIAVVPMGGGSYIYR